MSRIIKNGLALFSQRLIPLEGLDDLPPIYRTFVRHFDIGIESRMIGEKFMHPEENLLITAGEVVYLPDPDNITLGYLFSPDESMNIELGQRFDGDEDDDIDWAMYRQIGEDGTGHYSFLVGLDDSNLDQIFIESPDLSHPGGNRITYIASDIYSFILSFALIEFDQGVGYGVGDYSRLYRNWGEAFWRVKP